MTVHAFTHPGRNGAEVSLHIQASVSNVSSDTQLRRPLPPVGDAIARATADVETIDDLFSSSILTLLGETARLAATVEALQPPILYQVERAAGSQPGLMSQPDRGPNCPR